MINFFDWLKANKLSLNALKMEFIRIETNQNVHKTAGLIAVRVDSVLIRRENKSRYLGPIVDDRLSWKVHIVHISSKALRSVGILKHIRACLTKLTLQILYRTLIERGFRYCNTT